MKKFLTFCFFTISLTCSPVMAEQVVDKIVMIVNDDVVTQSELNQATSIYRGQLRQQQVQAPANEILRKVVLDQLINKKLQLQFAKSAGVNVDDVELNRIIKSIAERNHMSVTDLYARINSEGMKTSAYRNELRDQLTIQKLQQQQVSGNFAPSQTEVDRFLRSRSWQAAGGTKQYWVEDILIPLAENPSADELAGANAKVTALMSDIKAGKSFADAAKAEGLDDNDLGWRSLNELPTIFVQPVGGMQAKQVASPIKAPNGLHIIRLNAVKNAGAGADTAPDRKQVEYILSQRKFDEASQIWVSRLRAQAYVQPPKGDQ